MVPWGQGQHPLLLVSTWAWQRAGHDTWVEKTSYYSGDFLSSDFLSQDGANSIALIEWMSKLRLREIQQVAGVT